MKRIFCGLVLLLGVCTLSAECAEPVVKTPPSLSDASAAGVVAGRDASKAGLITASLQKILRAVALGAVCDREKDPYIETLLKSKKAIAEKLMPATQFGEYIEVSVPHGMAFLEAYYSMFENMSLGYVVGYAASFTGRMNSEEKNPLAKARLKQAACDFSASTAKDIFFEMSIKVEPEK